MLTTTSPHSAEEHKIEPRNEPTATAKTGVLKNSRRSSKG